MDLVYFADLFRPVFSAHLLWYRVQNRNDDISESQEKVVAALKSCISFPAPT